MKISLFKNSFSDEPPIAELDIEEFVNRTRTGFWKKIVERVREMRDEKSFKKAKGKLPALTMSGLFSTRDRNTPIDQKLIKHSGYIVLDIDKKDNLKMRTQDLIDRECLCQYVSCSGEGVKIVYRCKVTKDPSEHRRIYDAAVFRLQKKGIKLKIDPIVKSIASLQYVSYDPQLFYFPKSKLVIQPLPKIVHKKREPSEDQKKDLEQLYSYIDGIGDRDVTKDYDNWVNIAFGLSYSFGEAGREAFHKISANYSRYSEEECNEKYDSMLDRDMEAIDRPITVSSVFQLLIDATPKVKLKQLAKKYNKGHAVGVGEDVEQGDLIGLVRYKMFLFKKVFDKEDNTLAELIPIELNLNEFEKLLREKGFYRYDGMYVQIVDNIVETVDQHDILRIITRHIEGDGDYNFTYNKTEFHFTWEEMVHLWRKIRALSTTFNQIATCLEHWKPDLLQDDAKFSYIPFRNGVVKIDSKGQKLIQYSTIKQQIWKEQILPREYKYTQEVGMFEDFFANVCGRGNNRKERIKHESYKRSLWYFGYMLHGFKRESIARAWMLYDIKAGNNGRTGKTIIGKAVSKIRNTLILDGKQIDFRNNRFILQQATPWTKVVFIDDPYKGMSIIPMFNMITGDSQAERKGMDPINLNLKWMIASNFIMEAEGRSESGRQFVTQLDDYYARGNSLTPVVDQHKKEFFTEWDEKDWAKFDSFAVRCIQIYLSKETPENKIIGNSTQIRFIQQYDRELFHELSNSFRQHYKIGKDKKLLIGQKILVNVVKDSSDFDGRIKCGKVVKEFLAAINSGNISITSVAIGNIPQMAYKLENQLEKLDFGEAKK